MSHFSKVHSWTISPQSYQKVSLLYKNIFPLMQWCSAHLQWHLCWESRFLDASLPCHKIHISLCLSLSWPGCPGITCWDWLRDRGQIKWVLWLAWTAMLERNRCCSLAHSSVPIAAEASYWWKEDTTTPEEAADAGHVCGHRLAKVGGGGEGEERAPERTDHLDHRPQRLDWQSQSEQQWTEDSQSADFPSPAFSLAALQQTHSVQKDFQKELQLGFFHQVQGIFFFFFFNQKEKVDEKAEKHQE